MIFWRFIIAFILGEVLHLVLNPTLFKKSHSEIKRAMLPGVFLGLSLFFQTYGLKFTSVTNSGFITALYVVMIPILGALFFKQKIKVHHIVFSLMAFTGMGFLLNLRELNVAKGEILTLAAALTAAFQIIFIGRLASNSQSAFRFNTYQTFWSWLTILPFLVIEVRSQNVPLWPAEVHPRALISMITLAIVVSLFAFYLQVRAQKILTTTTSSMLCLLEGPFSFIFAAIFLGERLGVVQLFGACLILMSCALSVIADRPQHGQS